MSTKTEKEEPEVVEENGIDTEEKEPPKEKAKRGRKPKNRRKPKTSKPQEKEGDEENAEPEAKPTKNSKAGKAKAAVTPKKKLAKGYVSDDDDRVPLLDQPFVVEGGRNRKTIEKFEHKENNVNKQQPVTIPRGKGKALGRIRIVNERLKRLRNDILRSFHRFVFGKLGSPNLLLENLQKFNGFPFAEDSDEYNRKLAVLSKYHMPELKEILFFLDLDMKIKKKEESVKLILNFLLLPKESEVANNPNPLHHPKRRATKRNYFESDEYEDIKKKKKAKAKGAKKEEGSESEEPAAKGKKSGSKAEKGKATENGKEEESDNNSELKKPAKKRKRNHMFEENNAEAEKPDETENADGEEQEEATTEESTTQRKKKKPAAGKKDKLSDEELRNFLKKVLAGANLEKVTMRTVYGLISSNYPNYDFSAKKDFIKDIVTSLIQP